jgi:hypothetical protein
VQLSGIRNQWTVSRDRRSVIRVLVTRIDTSTLPRLVPGTSPKMTIECVTIQRFWVLEQDWAGSTHIPVIVLLVMAI